MFQSLIHYAVPFTGTFGIFISSMPAQDFSVETFPISLTCERQLIRTRSVGIMAGTTRRNLDKTHEAIGSGMNQARTFPHELVIDCQKKSNKAEKRVTDTGS